VPVQTLRLQWPSTYQLLRTSCGSSCVHDPLLGLSAHFPMNDLLTDPSGTFTSTGRRLQYSGARLSFHLLRAEGGRYVRPTICWENNAGTAAAVRWSKSGGCRCHEPAVEQRTG